MVKRSKASHPEIDFDTAFQSELAAQLGDLPGHLRAVMTRHASLPEALVHLAAGIQAVVDELTSDPSSGVLQRTPTQLRALVAQGSLTLEQLLLFAGELKGLAWAVEAARQARWFAERPPPDGV